MKTILMIIMILPFFFLTACLNEATTSEHLEKTDEISLIQLEGLYKLEDMRELGKWLLYLNEQVLTDRIQKTSRYVVRINGREYPLTQNPFNKKILLCFLPERADENAIRSANIKALRGERGVDIRETDEILLEKVYIQKGEQNGTDLYELSVETYLNMKVASNPFVYGDGNLIRPLFVKTDEENAYTYQRYLNARQAAATHTADDAFDFLKLREDHESLLAFNNPNRVDVNGVISEPDTRDRLRQLGGMGTVTDGCTVTYDIRDNETDRFFADLKQSNLPTQHYRDCDIYEIQIKESTICLFYETSSGIFETKVEYATTNNMELIKNARFMATKYATCTDFNVKSGNEPYIRTITESATILKVASGTTVAEVKTRLESTDGSDQTFSFRSTGGILEDTFIFMTQPATLNVQSRKGGIYNMDYEIEVNPNPFVRLEGPSSPDSARDDGIFVWYDTINAAMTAGSDGATLTCWPGEYREVVNPGVKNFVLRSTDPSSSTIRDHTIINAAGTGQAAVMLSGGQSSQTVVEGFTITTAYSSGLSGQRTGRNGFIGNPGISVEGEQTCPEIRYNRIVQNGYEYGGGIYCANVSSQEPSVILKIHHNIIENNEAYYGGGIYVGNNRQVLIYENTFTGNNARDAGGAVKAGSRTVIMNKNEETWHPELLPGTVETPAEIEGVLQTNTYNLNTVNGSQSAEGAAVCYDRTPSPSADDLVIHAGLDWARVYGTFTGGEIARLFTDSSSLTEVASQTYTAPQSSRPAGVLIQIDYPIEPATDYYLTLQIAVEAQSTKVASTAISTPDSAVLVSPSDASTGMDTALTLDWNDAAGAVSYTVYLGTTADVTDVEKESVTETQYATTGLSMAMTYYWRIESVDAYGATASSDEASFTTAASPFDGGAGTKSNPYQIATAEQLNAIRGAYLGTDGGTVYYFEQTADIDLSGYSNWNPITIFYGSYDGGIYSISNLKITGTSPNRGLFGATKNATLTHIKLSNASVSGGSNVGLLVGANTGSFIGNCSATGTVTGTGNNVGGLFGLGQFGVDITSSRFNGVVKSTGSFVGGLAGQCNGPVAYCYTAGSVEGTAQVGGLFGINGGIGEVQNCYSTADVTGTSDVGGLIGWNNGGSPSNCYSGGKVTGSTTTGGLIGKNNGTVTGCYWDSEKSEQGGSSGGTALTTVNMRKQISFTGWDFSAVWSIDEGLSYPYLQSNVQEPKPGTLFAGGDGSEGNPYEVATADHLNNVRDYAGQVKFFRQIDDIDLTGETDWVPLGVYNSEYTGYYDGNGFKITNLTVNKDEDDMALFGAIKNATIVNVTFENADITGSKFAGGLVSYLDDSLLDNCHVQGKVTGTFEGHANIGLMVGFADGGIIRNCSVEGEVNGYDKIGGIAGVSQSGNLIQTSWASVTITGHDIIGGVVGYNVGADIEDCYCNGSVSCADGEGFGAGGFAGMNVSTATIKYGYSTVMVSNIRDSGGFCSENTETITSCFWETTGNIGTSSGGTGKTTAELKLESTFTDASWDFSDTWEIDPVKNNGYPYLKNNNTF